MSDKYVVAVYFGHDANIAIVGNGMIRHYEMERFDRKKHTDDYGQVAGRVPEIFKDAGISISQITAVAGIGLGDCYSSKRGRDYWNNLNEIDVTNTSFFGPDTPCYWMPHHKAHAAYTFYTSNFEKANILALDAGGDSMMHSGVRKIVTIATGKAEHAFGATEGIFTLDDNSHRRSPGAWWSSAAEQWFGNWQAAGTVMAAAGISANNCKQLAPDFSYETICEFKSLQSKTCGAFHDLRDSYKEFPDVCLGGGVALNGIAADSLLQRGDTNNVFTAPAANDGGLAVGAALFVLHNIVKEPRIKYSVETVSFAGLDCGAGEDKLDIDQVVTRLVNNEVVAVCNGRAESGPRALGHRSILSNPVTSGIKNRINQLKGRQPFRPVAPVFCIDKLPEGTREESTLYKSPNSMNFMTVIPMGPKSVRETLPDACHIDGSIRAQVVSSDHILGKIVMELGRRTGVYCVLNTSLNGKGEPIVNTREEAKVTTGKMGITLI